MSPFKPGPARTPVAIATLASFLFSLAPIRSARAAETEERAEAPAASATTSPATQGPPPHVAQTTDAVASTGGGPPTIPQAVANGNDPGPGPTQPTSLPNGADKTGVSSQAISLPQGSGKVQGMGESFSTQMSTGVASFTVPFALSHARGGAQPSLALSYSSAGGHGVAGAGWDVGVPFIARQTDRGVPQYDDPAVGEAWRATQDRFVFNGGQELVPICLVTGGACSGALAGEAMPAWAEGWRYFRARVEGSYLRFFWSSDFRTWRVQSKTGETMELGAPLAAAGATSSEGVLETDPANPSHIFRWNISRQYDAQGGANASPSTPVNIVVYRYDYRFGNMAYLSDIYDTPPAASPGAQVQSYAHHTALRYDDRPDTSFSFRRGWRVDQTKRLTSVEVASAPFGGVGRKRVRFYQLVYNSLIKHPSLLDSVQMEGRCGQNESSAATEGTPFGAGCTKLPAMTFAYQHVTSGTSDLPGFEPFDETVHPMNLSPPHSIDEELTDLFDVNADGLPDVVVTAPGIYNGMHAAFFNGEGGLADKFSAAFRPMNVLGVPAEDTNIIKLSNYNVTPHDLDGDGIINLLHMPKALTYSVYAPVCPGQGYSCNWIGHQVSTASRQSPKIDFQQNQSRIRVMDVNADGLVDVVFSSGTEYQTFFALGRYPGGDGQFGQAKWTGATSSTASAHEPTVNDPVASCLPWSATPALLSDHDVRIGDMNGDGYPDIVRVRPGDVRYWPGRGNGFWGTGDPTNCPGGTFGQNRDIAMATSPQFGVVGSGESLLLDDINGDGLDDLVKVAFNAVSIYLNVNGDGWTDRHIMSNTPPRTGATNRVRLVDMNGSGTRDLLWGDGNDYKYIDVLGGQRPWVLTNIANGNGKTTDIEYSTSTAQMLAAEHEGQAWQSKSPVVHHVVSRVTDHDNLQLAGRPAGTYVTVYKYRDPVFDGRQREFRGFKSARATRVGDSNSPTSVTSSTFLLGECKNDEGSATSPCTPDGLWMDNPREALKGLPILSETSDETGATYLSTVHHTYRLRKLYTGLDGREVRVAFESGTDSYGYDTAPFTGNAQTLLATAQTTPAEVDLELTPQNVQSADTRLGYTLRSTTGRAHTRGSTVVDFFGNATTHIAEGCVDTSTACPMTDETILSITTPGRPPGDNGRWLWRTVESYVQGSDGVPRNHTYFTYDASGNPTTTQAVLAGSLGLDRATPVAPVGASSDGLVTVSRVAYDGVGNAVAASGPNNRCRTMGYATDFGDLVTDEYVYVGAVEPGGQCAGAGGTSVGGRGHTTLHAQAIYDRGLGAVISVIDIHTEKTSAVYDDLGRVSQLFKPSPTRVGSVSALPSALIDYIQPTTNRPFWIVHTQTQDGVDDSDGSVRNAYAYVDGLGRAILTIQQADPLAGDKGAWIAGGLTEYDNKGAARRAFLPWFTSEDPLLFNLAAVPSTAYGRQRYDAFGRQVQTFGLDGTITLQSAYHALGVDKWDAADLTPGPHQGTYASARQDGHGRAVSVTERIHVGGAIELRETQTKYLSTGEPQIITRARGGDRVVRWLRYDTLGRMVLNVEPNTTRNFNESPATDPGAMKAWRYAYDDNGDLVGTSDARGCGSNFLYDAAGRILAEDYVPCTPEHQAHSAPDLATGDGAEVFYFYDSADPSMPLQIDDCTINPGLLLGRLASVSDRASKTLTSFDGRGRSTCVARQVAKPGIPDIVRANRYAPRAYTQTVAYDADDRPVAASTGAKVTELLGTNQQSFVTSAYTKRGTVKSVSSSYGDLVTSITRDADGPVTQIVYGDTARTTTSMSYDQRRRLSSVQTYRGPPALWSTPNAYVSAAPPIGGPPTSFQRLLDDVDYVYDVVDNPVEIRDWRDPSEWPDGAKPVTRKMQYDDLYRLTHIDYQYAAGDDTWISPFAAENTGASSQQDPRRAKPSPHVAFAKRVLSQSFQYDWLGNTMKTDDDAKGFYDRSLGTITNGTASVGPYQLQGASGGAYPRDGALTTKYDDSGNLLGLSAVRNPAGTCLGGASCSQRYAYDWDEVGRMSRARRWDGSGLGVASDPVPDAASAVELRYAYDGADQRVLKTAVDPATGDTRHTVYIFGGLELRRTHFDGADYERSAFTEVVYLFAHGVRLARLHYATNDVPTLSSGNLHVLFDLPDHLGSSSVVIDGATSELVEASTYQAYGGAESDYRPERWDAYREDYRFTGKEDDVEVGLAYFGKRYYAQALGRWISADPLAVHALGADLNVYAYVHGAVLRATDLAGLTATEHVADGKVDSGALDQDFVGPVQTPPADPPPASGHEPPRAPPARCRPMPAVAAGPSAVDYTPGGVTQEQKFQAMVTKAENGLAGSYIPLAYAANAAGIVFDVSPEEEHALVNGSVAIWGAAASVAGAGAGRQPQYNTTQPTAIVPAATMVTPASAAPTTSYTPYAIPVSPGTRGPDPRLTVDTRTFDPTMFGSTVTANGGIRNSFQFWQQFDQQAPEAISHTNRMLMNGFNPRTWEPQMPSAPRVDSQFIESFPQYGGYSGDRLLHHHIGEGPIAVPVPGQTHIGSGGPWHGRQ